MNVVYIPTPLKREAFQDIGSRLDNKGKVHFRVWAPRVKRVSVEVVTKDGRRMIPMEKSERGYYESLVEDVREGDRYFYNFGGDIRFPDPASRFQPEGVHGPSEVVDYRGFSWGDKDWQGLKLKDFIIYELHTATFTKEGTFDSIIPFLPYLKELGITAIELMPVAQCPGSRNWGYDGVYPFAPQNSYGGPRRLKALINECHRAGFAVILDVVYNHIGPEGNYLNRFGYYFTDRYRTPWGDAINFDGPYSDEVRHGRRAEFNDFQWEGDIPDPQAEETFMRAKLNMELRHHGKHKILFAFYKHIIQLRKEIPAFGNLKKEDTEVECFEIEKILYVKKWSNNDKIFYICNFSESLVHINVPIWDCGWKKLMDSSEELWGGPGDISVPYIGPGEEKVSLRLNPCSIVLYKNFTGPDN